MLCIPTSGKLRKLNSKMINDCVIEFVFPFFMLLSKRSISTSINKSANEFAPFTITFSILMVDKVTIN